jgi:hypothetical protein
VEDVFICPAFTQKAPGSQLANWTAFLNACGRSKFVERGRGRPRYSRPGGLRYIAVVALRFLFANTVAHRPDAVKTPLFCSQPQIFLLT